MTTRRRFLQQSTLVSLSPWVPAIFQHSTAAAAPRRDDRILVIIQLDGGNDGLNTVVPFADENYARFRQELRIRTQDVLKLTDSVGLHPGLKPVAELFEEGRLAIVQGVGYPNPNRSHFRSMAIWQHARLEERLHDSIGWLGRAADAARSENVSAPDSIYVGEDRLPVALRGRRAHAISLTNEDDLKLRSPLSAHSHDGRPNTDELSSFVTRTLDQSYQAARRFSESSPAQGTDTATYPSSQLAQKLQLASRLIKMNGGARIYYVSQLGYDTHSAQAGTHRRLLSEFSAALRAFLDDLQDCRLEERVLVLGFSEFGRRVRENGSAGTDHGAAAPVFLAGKAVQGGILGDHPSLSDLDAGDLKMSIDFRRVYATILDRWLNIPSDIVLGGTFESLPCVRS